MVQGSLEAGCTCRHAGNCGGRVLCSGYRAYSTGNDAACAGAQCRKTKALLLPCMPEWQNLLRNLARLLEKPQHAPIIGRSRATKNFVCLHGILCHRVTFPVRGWSCHHRACVLGYVPDGYWPWLCPWCCVQAPLLVRGLPHGYDSGYCPAWCSGTKKVISSRLLSGAAQIASTLEKQPVGAYSDRLR